MAKKGIAQITGSKALKLGEVGHYRITKIYRKEDDHKVPHAKWRLYAREKDGWRELKPVAGTPSKIGSETTITITNQKLLGKELLLEAYLYEPEKSSPPGIIIKVEKGNKKIERIDLYLKDDTKIPHGGIVKYGQSIIVKVFTVNMPHEKVLLTLYEDDENGEGHSEKNEKNKVDSVEMYLDKDGFAMHTFKLPIDFMKIANAYKDGTQDKYHEYYINLKSATEHKASQNVNVPNPDYTFPEEEIEEVVISVKAKEVGFDPMPKTGRSVSIVQEPPEKEKKDVNKCPNCEKDITLEEINKVLGDKEDQSYRTKIVNLINEYIKLGKKDKKELHINTCLRKAHFLSEIATETSLLEKKLTEGNTPPYYSEDNIKSLWPGKYKELKSSGKLSETASERPQKKLLNLVYGHKNGNKGGDDGWNYRGKGLIQLTGRTNYKNASDFLKRIFPEDYNDLEVNYDKVAEVKYAVLTAIAFWEGKAIYNIADVSKTKETVPNVRFFVNSYDKGNARTKKFFVNAIDAFNVSECKKDKVEKDKSNSRVKLDFVGKTAKESALSGKTKNILIEVGEASGNYYIPITSTARTSHDQARIMYDNCKSNIHEQRKTYKAPGQRVIDVYENNKSKSRETVIKLMEDKINELGPSTVSKHLANPEVLNTFDISYGNLSMKTNFWNEMKKRPELDAILTENNCYHIQIKQK